MHQRIHIEQSFEASILKTMVQGIMLGLRQLFRLVDCTEPFLLYLLIAHDPRRFPFKHINIMLPTRSGAICSTRGP